MIVTVDPFRGWDMFNHAGWAAVRLARISLAVVTLVAVGASMSARGDEFPAQGDFNGMAISYGFSGASATSVKDPEASFTWTRTVTGTLGSGQLRVSGTAKSQGIPSYPTDVVVRVWVGAATREFKGRIAGDPGIRPRPQFPLDFDVAVDIPGSATTGGFRIELTGQYNGGPRVLAVEGAFSRSGAPPPPPAASPTRRSSATHDTFDEAADAVAEHISSFDGSCFAKAKGFSLGDPEKFRKALNPDNLIIEDGTTEAGLWFLAHSANATTLRYRSVGVVGTPLKNLMYLRFKVPVAGGDAALNDLQKETLWHESVHHIESLHEDPPNPAYYQHAVYKERNAAYLDAVVNQLKSLAGIERTLRTDPSKLSGADRVFWKDQQEKALDRLKEIPERLRDLEAGIATRELVDIPPKDREPWPPDLRELRGWTGINIRWSDILDRYASGDCGEELRKFALGLRGPADTVQLSVDDATRTERPGSGLSSDRAAKMATSSSLVQQGRDYNDKGQWTEAVAAFTRAIEASPDAAQAYAGRGLAKIALNANDDALSDINRALRLDPNCADAYLGRSVVNRVRKDFQGALEDAHRAVALAPSDHLAYLARGLARQLLNDLQGAAGDFTRAIQLTPGDARSYFYRGRVRLDSSDNAGALDDLNRYVGMVSNDGGAFLNRGLAKQRLGDTTGAIDDFTRALQLTPSLTFSYFFRGLGRFQMTDNAGALDDYNRFLDVFPADSVATSNRGLVKQRLGDIAGAISDYEKAIALDPNNETAKKSLSTIPGKRGAEIFNSMNGLGVANRPTAPATFIVSRPHVITMISTYHWNDGRGTGAGAIRLVDANGQVFGPWPVIGAAGQGGAPNVNWTCTPNAEIPAGTYTIVDSDPATWSQNAESGGRGMAVVKGYPVDFPRPATAPER